MKNITLTTISMIGFMLLIYVSTSCNSLSGEKWLLSIFQCDIGDGYCLPDDKEVFTERYQEFYHESLDIFEYPYFETENEQIAAIETFSKKWKGIYPLNGSVWAPFGQGNGDKLENVIITHLSDLKFTALIDYGEENVFFNTLLLIPSGDAFLIDYIETEEIYLQQGDISLPFLQNLALAKLQLGTNPDDAKRLLGKPQSENSETGPLEVSGYIDEDYIVTTTTMEYDGIQLVYEDDSLIHASISKLGKSFGWIICKDKNCDKDFLIKKFELTKYDLFENEDGNKAFISMEILYIEVNFDENDLVKTIEFNSGP